MSIRILEPAPGSVTRSPDGRGRFTYSVGWSIALVFSDVAMFALSSLLAVLLGLSLHEHLGLQHWDSAWILPRLVIAQAVYICSWLVIFERLGLYRRSFALTIKDELYYTSAALLIGTVPQLILFTLVPSISTSRAVIGISLPFSIIFVGSARALLHYLRSAPAFRPKRRVAIVGKADRVAAAYASLDLSDKSDSLLLAVDDVDSADRVSLSEHGEIEGIEWLSEAREWGCNMLILTEIAPPAVMPTLLQAAARSQIQVAFAPPRIQRHAYTLTLQTDGQQVLIIPSPLIACTPRVRLHKRIFDVVFASLALAIFAPVIGVCALAVWVESGSPVLFRQKRVGLNGKAFHILKFRSMRNGAEDQSGAVWAMEGDSRRTRTGVILRRLSFDELPQLFNVLRGDMSLVGPRPERPEFVDLFRRTIPRYDERHLVQPGITGWSQVHMKRLLQPSDAEEKLKYDLQYIENWSPFLDVSVLLQTAFEFLFHRAG